MRKFILIAMIVVVAWPMFASSANAYEPPNCPQLIAAASRCKVPDNAKPKPMPTWNGPPKTTHVKHVKHHVTYALPNTGK